MGINKGNKFEAIFGSFVSYLGGEILPEASTGHTSDYLFRRENILVELKCLQQDQTARFEQKLQPLVLDWIRKNGQVPAGFMQGRKYIIDFPRAPKEIQDAWWKELRTA